MRDKPLLLSYHQHQFQHAIWELLGRTNLMIIHRRAGKSDLLAFIASMMLFTIDLPISIIVAAPTRIKAKDLLFHRVKELLESKSSQHIEFLKSDLQIINKKTGARIMFFACSSEHGSSVRGHRANVLIVDELDEADAKEWNESFLPTQQGLPPETAHIQYVIASGTPRGSASLLTQMYNKIKPLSPDFQTIKDLTFAPKDLSNIHQNIPEQLTPIPPQAYREAQNSDYRLFHLSIEDTKRIDPSALEADKLFMGEQQYRREYFCDLEATADDTLFSIGDLSQCANPTPSTINTTPDQSGHINYPDRQLLSFIEPSAGLDVARTGDGSILYIRQGDIPLFLGKIAQTDSHEGLKQQINQIDKLLRRYQCKRLGIDSGGLGQFFCDALEDELQHYVSIERVAGNAQPAYHWREEFNNLRSNLYGLLSYKVRHHAPLPNVPHLLEELSAHTTAENPHDKRTALIPKKLIKSKINRSPDYSDAVVYSYIFDAELDQDAFLGTLQDLKNGRYDLTSMKNLSSREVLDRFAEFEPQDQDNSFEEMCKTFNWLDDDSDNEGYKI